MGILSDLQKSFAYSLSQRFPQFVNWIDAVSAVIDSGVGLVYTPSTPAAWNPSPTSVALALDELALERPFFVFQPGGAVSGNIFTSWAALYAAAIATPGPKVIYFDDTFQAITIPVGSYDLGRGCIWRGVTPSSNGTNTLRTTITCPDGVVFSTPPVELLNIRITYSGVGVLFPIPGTSKFFPVYLTGNSIIFTTAAGGRVFGLGVNAFLYLAMTADNFVSMVAGSYLWDVTAATAQAQLVMESAGSVNSMIPVNVLKGVAGASYVFIPTRLNQFQAGTATPPNAQQTDMPGGIITMTGSAYTFGSPNIFYTPAVGAQWVDPDPTTVKAALDRIAAVVSVGGATPIP